MVEWAGGGGDEHHLQRRAEDYAGQRTGRRCVLNCRQETALPFNDGTENQAQCISPLPEPDEEAWDESEMAL